MIAFTTGRGREQQRATAGAGVLTHERAAMTDGQRDAIEVLEQDHREVEQMFAELESLRGASTEDALERRKTLTEQNRSIPASAWSRLATWLRVMTRQGTHAPLGAS